MDRKHLANAIRALSMDGVQKANSGHPGAPMGMADIAEVLWRGHLNHNPSNPEWADRDRFVLSNGHGSMLIYSLLHLSGYELSIDDLKNFRQLHSKTPGHPEYGYAPGIETTTGPLGQGITNAVGMAMAEKALAAQFNKPGHDIVDHFTYVFMGDGCLMEGISHEACSLAGTLGLGKLIAFWDDNGISIDGHVEGWFSDDTPKRFEAYGWHVIPAVDGHNAEAINAAIEAAKADPRPTLICTKTIIGFGSPNKSGSHDCHGAPLGAEEIAATRKELGWEHGPFEIPQEVYAEWSAKEAGAAKEAAWNEKFAAYEAAYPELAAEFKRRVNGELPALWEEKANQIIADLQANPANIASRKASQNALEAFGKMLPEFMGGSADLAPSNLTMWSGSKSLEASDFSGNYIHYGVREFGMTAIMNGIALHGGFVPYGATFLMFMEYARNAMRMAALMKIQNIQVYTHDSIGLGEDGP
ncbi:transketolase, partial [Vibrio vulnificus]|nr:transketolase [Vibrio vulnificus]